MGTKLGTQPLHGRFNRYTPNNMKRFARRHGFNYTTLVNLAAGRTHPRPQHLGLLCGIINAKPTDLFTDEALARHCDEVWS